MSASSKGRNKQNGATLQPDRPGHKRSSSTGSSSITKVAANYDNQNGGRAASGSSSTSRTRTDKDSAKDLRLKSEDISDVEGISDDRPKRILILSNKIKNVSPVTNSLLPQVVLVQYRYESGSFDAILNQIEQAVDGDRVTSIACILHTKPGSVLFFTNGDQKEVNKNNTQHKGVSAKHQGQP